MIFFIACMQHAAVALSALIRALDSLKMAAVVRYAYDRRSNPQVGAAFPCIKDKYEVCGFTSNRKHTMNDLSSVCCILVSLILSVCYTWGCRLWRISDSSHSQCWKTTRSSHLQVKRPTIQQPVSNRCVYSLPILQFWLYFIEFCNIMLY